MKSTVDQRSNFSILLPTPASKYMLKMLLEIYFHLEMFFISVNQVFAFFGKIITKSEPR